MARAERKKKSSADRQPKAPEAGMVENAPKRLEWLRDSRQWGTRVKPGKHGLTLDSLNVGIYGEVPEESTEMTRMPRGSFPVPGVPRQDVFPINKKVELWADNAADLYEEAIQRRWTGADIPWDSLEPLPQDVELAFCQLSTELGQQASIESDVMGEWLHRMSYAYHEIKNFLATHAFDSGRHTHVFHQRALANGGTLGLESSGWMNRRLLESRAGWTETALYLYIVRGPLTLLLYRYGEAYAQNSADQTIFRLCMQDKARHMAYGMSHLRYAIREKGSDFVLGLLRLMSGVERDMAKEMADPVLWEALAIICGGGVSHMAEGMGPVRELQRRYIEEYLLRMQWIGVDKTEENLHEELAAYLNTGEKAPA